MKMYVRPRSLTHISLVVSVTGGCVGVILYINAKHLHLINTTTLITFDDVILKEFLYVL